MLCHQRKQVSTLAESTKQKHVFNTTHMKDFLLFHKQQSVPIASFNTEDEHYQALLFARVHSGVGLGGLFLNQLRKAFWCRGKHLTTATHSPFHRPQNIQ